MTLEQISERYYVVWYVKAQLPDLYFPEADFPTYHEAYEYAEKKRKEDPLAAKMYTFILASKVTLETRIRPPGH